MWILYDFRKGSFWNISNYVNLESFNQKQLGKDFWIEIRVIIKLKILLVREDHVNLVENYLNSHVLNSYLQSWL